MTAKKVAKKVAKKTAKTVKTRSAKTATARAKRQPPPAPPARREERLDPALSLRGRPPTAPRLWGLAAYIAAAKLAMDGAKAWDDRRAGAARVLALRTEGVAAKPADETFKVLARPSGFTTWGALAERLAEVVIPAAKGTKGPRTVSPYAVIIADDEAHAFFDPRGRLAPTSEMLASVDAIGVLDSVKLQPMTERGRLVEYVADGRQRINTVRAVNLLRIRRWYEAASGKGGLDTPPELIVEVPAEVLDGTAAEAQRAGGVLNAKALRRDDTFQDLVHRAPQLRRAGYRREEIAVQLGCSIATVTNLLALQQLAPELAKELQTGSLPPACAYVLAGQPAEHQAELWQHAQRVPAPRRKEHLRQLIAAEALVEERRAVVEGGALDEVSREVDRKNLARAEAALAELRDGKVDTPVRPRKWRELGDASRSLVGLDGEGPRLARAALDFAAGTLDLEALLEVLRGSSATVVSPLAVECPACCAAPGDDCYLDDDDFEEGEEGDDVVHKAGEFHNARKASAKAVEVVRGGAV